MPTYPWCNELRKQAEVLRRLADLSERCDRVVSKVSPMGELLEIAADLMLAIKLVIREFGDTHRVRCNPMLLEERNETWPQKEETPYGTKERLDPVSSEGFERIVAGPKFKPTFQNIELPQWTDQWVTKLALDFVALRAGNPRRPCHEDRRTPAQRRNKWTRAQYHYHRRTASRKGGKENSKGWRTQFRT